MVRRAWRIVDKMTDETTKSMFRKTTQKTYAQARSVPAIARNKWERSKEWIVQQHRQQEQLTHVIPWLLTTEYEVTGYYVKLVKFEQVCWWAWCPSIRSVAVHIVVMYHFGRYTSFSFTEAIMTQRVLWFQQNTWRKCKWAMLFGFQIEPKCFFSVPLHPNSYDCEQRGVFCPQ